MHGFKNYGNPTPYSGSLIPPNYTSVLITCLCSGSVSASEVSEREESATQEPHGHASG